MHYLLVIFLAATGQPITPPSGTVYNSQVECGQAVAATLAEHHLQSNQVIYICAPKK